MPTGSKAERVVFRCFALPIRKVSDITRNELRRFLLVPLLTLASHAQPKDVARLSGPVSDGTPPEQVEPPEKIEFSVESTRQVKLPDRKLTIRRVSPPQLPEKPLENEAAEKPDKFRGESPLANDILDTKLLLLSATVYQGPVTHLRWWINGTETSAWASIDFHDFSGVHSFINRKIQYGLVMGIGNGEELPEDAKPPRRPDSIFLETQDSKNPEAAAIRDALVSLYANEKTELVRARHSREAAARKAANEPPPNPPNPPNPPDIILNIWDKPSRPLPAKTGKSQTR